MAIPRPKQRTTQDIASSTVEEVVSEFARVMSELRADLGRSRNGSHIPAGRARPVPVGINGTGATTRPTTGSGAIMGFSFTNYDTSTTANITIYLYDGPDSNAPKLFEVTLAPGESTRDWFEGGIHIGDAGLFVTSTGGNAGTFSGVVFLAGAR